MGGKLVGIATTSIAVSVKRPQDAEALTIAAPSSFGWTEEAAVSYARHQYLTLPTGSEVRIVITIEEGAEPTAP